MRSNREDEFLAGLEVLRPFFEERDFELRVCEPFEDEEGVTYSAQFVWGSHAVTLVNSSGLGPVIYSIGNMSIEHTAYLDALDVRLGAAFPSPVEDRGSDFDALLEDLERLLTPFFEEPEREFMEVAATHGSKGRPVLPGCSRR